MPDKFGGTTPALTPVAKDVYSTTIELCPRKSCQCGGWVMSSLVPSKVLGWRELKGGDVLATFPVSIPVGQLCRWGHGWNDETGDSWIKIRHGTSILDVITINPDSVTGCLNTYLMALMRGSISGEALMAVEWGLLGIAFVLIIARLNLRLNYLRLGFVLSDWFMCAAFVAGACLSSVDITIFRRGIYHKEMDFELSMFEAPKHQKIAVYKTFFILYFPFYTEQYFNKGTLIALYFEIFGQHSKRIRASLFSITFFCVAGYITTIFLILFNCKLGCYWSIDYPCTDHCMMINDNVGWAIHFTADIAIFIVPLVYISQLQMNRAQKISASVTFGIGFINIAVTLSRWFVVQSVVTPNPSLTTGEALAVADGHIGLIVAILPSLRPYLRMWRRKASSSSSSSQKPFFEDRNSKTPRKETPSYQSTLYPESRLSV